MNEAAYDFAAIGNHEFDYGMERLFKVRSLTCRILRMFRLRSNT